MRSRGALIRLSVFAAMSIALTGLVLATIINPSFQPQVRYRAMFKDVSGLRAGDVVRVAGVDVGKVTSERLVNNQAEVTFSADKDEQVTDTTQVAVRYQNLLGQRYLALVRGTDAGKPLAPGTLIPMSRTAEALDLTALFNGFQPLFQALTPDQINALSLAIVQALQGEGGAVDSLLQQSATLATNLADRDALIAQVIEHLASFLQTVSAHDAQLGTLVDQMQRLAAGLAADRNAIGDSLSHVDALAASVGGLVAASQPALDHDISSLKQISDVLVANQDKLGAAVQGLPALMSAFVRALGYGDWANLYVCNLALQSQGQLTIGGIVPIPVNIPQGAVGDQSQHSGVCR